MTPVSSDATTLDSSHWLESKEFYEVCQSYRHAQDVIAAAPNLPNASEAFEALKEYIRQKEQELEERHEMIRAECCEATFLNRESY